MAKITVLTLTARPNGVVLVDKALSEQGFEDWEWIIGTPNPEEVKKLITVPATIIPDPPKPKNLYWQLYRQYNRCIEQAQGKLIISWQDYTYTDPDALEKFWFYYTHGYENTLISGVGHKYKDDSWREVVWQDPRARQDQGTFYPCYYTDIEWNFCAVPKKAFYAVGGFDEELDRYSSVCGLDVADRLDSAGGWDFHLDQTQITKSLEHGRLPDWDERSALKGAYMVRRAELKADKQWPMLNYL